MCKKTAYLLSFVLVLGSVSSAADIVWTDLGADHLWSNPENWDLGTVPTAADDVLIDVPAAAAPNGPVIQDGIAAECHGIWTEAPGEPVLTMTGGSLVVGDWIWWGDGDGSFGIWTMSGGTVDVADEFELGWGGGAGTLTMTGGTINAGRAVIPTGSGAFGELFLQGGTYSVTLPDGLQVNANGLIDITEGTLVLEGDDTAKVNDLIAAGQITAYGGAGEFELDFDGRNPGKTTLTAFRELATGPLRLDFNSNQDSGGDSTTAGDPSLSAAAHNQTGWSSYHANHEVIAEFTTANYDGITVTPDWPNTTDNRVRQSIDRSAGNDDNWDDAAGDLNLVTDFIGIDTRTGNGGNGDWDGTTGTPTYMTLALGGLAAGDYVWTSFHHDTEHVFGPFAVWLSTDGGATFTQLDDGVMTDSTPGGSPDSGATEVGPDAYSLSSTYHASFHADGINAVVFRFAPYSEGAVHRQIWGMNGFVLELDRRVVLFAEDFEGLPLGPNVDEELAGDAVWTDTPPEGWAVDESGIPGIGNPATDGVTEWAGWAFADKAWWTEAAEDQNRSQFVLGSGTVAVADPDEWDDADRLPIPISADPYDTWLTTPAIDIFGLEAGTVQLKFDSSWRPEFDDDYHQTASITASFDGGEPVTVLLWESDGSSANFKPDSTNETVVVDLDVPKGAASVVLEFGLSDAGNDWWWAIDNVEVSGIPRETIVVLSEDFEGLALGPNVDESVAGEQVWTDTPPEGWVVDESGIPGIGDPATDGVTEWAGWAFADKAWWTEAAEDQNRSQFVLASGTVAVADPDEWDDADHADAAAAGWYKTFLSTPEVDISGLEGGSLKLTFDSSWRPEFDSNYHQTANITASFDGAEPVEVLLWESDSGSANFKPDSTNETVVVYLQNPAGAKSVVLEFGLFDAGNDWWWAIDNVEVSGFALPEPVDPGTDGLVAFYALDGDANDSSGNGIDGTIHNADTGGLGDGGSVWVDDPERGTVISFNGTAEGAHVRAGDIPQMTLTNDFTWSFWAKHSAENTADNDIILGNRMDENAVDFVPRQFIKFTPTKFEWHMNGNGDDNLDYDDIPADVWLHHAVVKTGDQLTYYRNGAEASSGTFTQPLDFPQPLYFGGDNEGSAGENWGGYMSDVRIYDRALSGGEIRYLAGSRDEAENLLANGGFEEDEPILDDPDWVQWCTWNPAEGAGSNVTIVDTDAIDGARSLKVEPIGPENWHFILVNISFAADLSKNYAATFWAKAEAARPLTLQMKASDNSVDAWGATDFELTTDWAEYGYTSEVLHTDVKLEFLCAASEVPFLLDSVAVYEAQ